MSVRLAAALASGAVLATSVPAAPAAPTKHAAPVVAIIGDAGFNPLHVEFRTRDGRDPAYPAGMPEPVMVPLPRQGTFEERLRELQGGPLGRPVAGTLYALRGTRLLIYATDRQTSLLTERGHGTGTTAAAVGNRTGTAPDALGVFIIGNTADGHTWLGEQSWIDVASLSAYTIGGVNPACRNADEGRGFHRSGGLLFASGGNTTDWALPLFYPNGLAETYQVGGIDRTGRTWLPPRPESEPAYYAAGTVVRPYETGARFDFFAADSDSVDGTMQFGGTSGASPTVAGYAAGLVAHARSLLGHRGTRRGAVLASHGAGAHPPSRGPLADGSFTRDELVDLLHRSAVPAEQGENRYLLEGFGATDHRSHAFAVDVLHGRAQLPERPGESARHEQAESLRAALSSRC